MTASLKDARNPDAQSAVCEAVVRAELDVLLASPSLRDSELLKRLLRYVVERTLAGERDKLKEYRLAVEVFDRDASFDPRLDPLVRMAARRLRSKLEDHYENAGRESLVRIEVPKGGYAARFVAITAPQAARSGQTATQGSWHAFASVIVRRRRGLLALGAVLLVLGTAALYWRQVSKHSANAPPPSLAVLPFLNLTGNPDYDYFSDGLTDELTSALSKLQGVRVVARTSAFKFKGKNDDVRAIGRQLNVSSVMEGSVESNGDRLRITTQLIRTSDGYHLWAETYELTPKDTFAIEDEISRAVARVISVRLSEQAESKAQRHPVDPSAHELYLRGQYEGMRGPQLENKQNSVMFYNQALDRDPLYAEAYAGLAAAYAAEGASAQAAPAEVYPKARAAAQRAIELDPNLPLAFGILANISLFYDWDFPAGENGFRRALELDPNNAAVHQWYGLLLLFSRRFDEATEQFHMAKELNPLAAGIDMTMVMLVEAERNYDLAIELDRKFLTEHNQYVGHLLLGLLYADKKQYKDAIEEGQKAVALVGNDADANLVLANLYAQAGQRNKALVIVQKVLAGDAAFVPAFGVAGVYAELGDREQMYQWLDKAIEQRSPACLKLDVTESFDRYRSEERFQTILAKTGLPN